ncbi:hypothetical protein [Beijerinckia sp. L45]|uniref:hypothetical protein n=1 Tax=Beijerinckia sp. L45 TaxID=1641855 RepID=UPI00131B1FB9|nr:hypothetical protein [Beijerinckia sp. L45]
MLKILALICASSTNPTACDVHSAMDVITVGRANTPQQCGFQGQAMMAPTTLIPDPSKQYMKIVCVRDQVAKQ